MALVVACLGMPAGGVPLAGRLDLSVAWSPGNPNPGITVTFTATAADGDGTVRFAQLCYGDGTCSAPDYPPTTGQGYLTACVLGDNYSHQWTHPFPHTGKFPVTLTVTTRGCPGVSDETKTLTVQVKVG